MKKIISLLALAAATAFGAVSPGGGVAVSTTPSGALSFLRVNSSGYLLLAAVTPQTLPTPGGNVAVAVDPNGNLAFLQVDANGALLVSGTAASGPITTSGLTMNTARMLGRTTAGVGAIEEMTSAAVQSFVGISIASGKTLTASNSITLAGTDSTTMTFPSTSATIARTDAANTFSGVQTFSGSAVVLSGTRSVTAYTTAGALLSVSATSITDTTSSGTVVLNAVNALARPTLLASSATTYTNSATLYIAGPPIASTNVTQTNAWCIYAATGSSWFRSVTQGDGTADTQMTINGLNTSGNGARLSFLRAGTTIGYVGTTAGILGVNTSEIALYSQSAGIGLYVNGGSTAALSIASTGAITTSSSITTAAPTAGSAAAWKLGGNVTGAGLAVSSTSGIRINAGGTDYTLAVLTTNP